MYFEQICCLLRVALPICTEFATTVAGHSMNNRKILVEDLEEFLELQMDETDTEPTGAFI
jgi:hypothetical protein